MNTDIVNYELYWCNTMQQHYLLLGYFGGGSINFKYFKEIATQFADLIEVDIDSINIEEITNSRTHKYHKFLTSSVKGQVKLDSAKVLENVYQTLTR